MGFFTLSGTVFILQPHDVPKFLHLPFKSTQPIGVIFLVLLAEYVFLACLRKRPIKVRGLELTPLGLGLTFVQIGIASLDRALAGCVLYILLPPIVTMSYPKFLGVFMLAQGAGIISQIPGGLGVFEIVILFMLSPTYSAPVVLGMLLVYRVIYYLIPFIISSCILVSYELLQRKKFLRWMEIVLGKWAAPLIPHVFASLTFLGGAVLLFSGALPVSIQENF